MRSLVKSFIIFLFVIATVIPALRAQVNMPFYKDIQSFKKQDSLHFPPAHAILFVGSSSFTKWVDVQDYFPGYNIINRGFGGSSLPDVIRYADDIIFPYRPKQIIIYCGENDFASSDTISVNTVYERFKNLFFLIRKKMPDVPVAYISMKPSPRRQHLMPEFLQANTMIKEFLKSKSHTVFIDVYKKMLIDDGTPVKDIFLQDSLHMNAGGYRIWQKIIQPYLMK
ncbi:MAG: GDSL-type esterase/lipase family protein [Ginsengibacter sp.]